MQKLRILLERIAQAHVSTENYRQEKVKDRISFTRRFELDRDSEVSPPYSFLACVAASTLIITFGLFCFAVRTFPCGGIRIEGPWGLRVEAQLGASTIPEKTPPPNDRK